MKRKKTQNVNREKAGITDFGLRFVLISLASWRFSYCTLQFRHVCAYLIWSQKSYSILLKHFERLREVHIPIGHYLVIARNLHPLCRSTHFLDCIIEPARTHKGDNVGLHRRNTECMGRSVRKKHAFSGSHCEDRTVNIEFHLTRNEVHKLMFSRVDMGRWLSAPSHLSDIDVKRSVIISAPRHVANKKTFVPRRIG